MDLTILQILLTSVNAVQLSSQGIRLLPEWYCIGCYADSPEARTLSHVGVVPGGPSAMTQQACQTACQSAGFILSGVEFSSECYCDNYLRSNGSLAPVKD